MLLDVIQQRIGDHDLIPHAGDHGFDVREQVRVQLRVAEQVVVIVSVDIAQDVVDQRLVVVSVNGAGRDLLNLPRRNVHAQPALLRRRKRLARQLLDGHRDILRRLAHVLFHVFGMEFRQRVTFADATYRHRAVQAQEQLAFIGQANVVTGQGVVQHRHHLLRHARIERHVGYQRVQAVLLRQLPEQIGQAGAGRHLAAKQLHAVARTGFQRQVVAMKPLAHLRHIALQRGAADEPFVRQILKLEGKGGRQKTHHQIMHALRPGPRDTQRARVGCLKLLIALGILNFELVAVAPAQDELRAVAGQQRVQGGDVRTDGSRGDRQPLRQLVLRQRLVLQQVEKLRQTLVRKSHVVVLLRLKVK